MVKYNFYFKQELTIHWFTRQAEMEGNITTL